jgi:hypothetical protein
MNSKVAHVQRRRISARGRSLLARAVVLVPLGLALRAPAQDGLIPPPPPPPPQPPAASIDRPKAPVPGEAAQQEAAKLIRDLFKADYAKRAPADVQALAVKLLQQGRETTDDPIGQFVLLRQARELAVQAGDLATALAAVEETGKAYAVDGLTLKAQALAAALLPAGKPAAALAETCLTTIDEAIAADRFDTATDLAAKAEAAARAAKDAALQKRALQRKKEIEAAKRESDLTKASEKVLASAPDDPAANLTVGRYAAAIKGDWARGAAMLAKGADAALKAAAEKDIVNPADPQAQMAAGDAWWEAAEKSKGQPFEDRWRGRARHWYEMALPGLTGLAKIKVEKRLEQTAASAGEAPVLAGLVGYWNFNAPFPQIPDLSPSKNHGTPHGGVKQVPGVRGSALSFDGAVGCVSLGTTGLPALEAPKAVAWWYRVGSAPGGPQDMIGWTGESPNPALQIGFREGRLVVWKFGGVILADGPAPKNDVWHHGAYTFDGKTHKLYVDGKLVNTSDVPPQNGKTRKAALGHLPGFGEHFKGALDEVRFYNRPISEAEVRQLYVGRR